MDATPPAIAGLRQMLDRLQDRAEAYRAFLKQMVFGVTPLHSESIALSTGEVESVEHLISELSTKLPGGPPAQALWEPSHPYCHRNEDKNHDGWAEQNVEYFRWFLMWIEKTRGFLDFLEGFASARQDLDLSPIEREAERAVSTISTDQSPLLQSVFISYGSPDSEFAQQLHDGLQHAGVRTFFFPEHSTPGDKLHHVMRTGVNAYDRVVLICSKGSLRRAGVVNELEETLQREAREGGTSILIPIMIDDHVFGEWSSERPDIAQAVRDRVVADFRGAVSDRQKFEKALGRVVASLETRAEIDGD